MKLCPGTQVLRSWLVMGSALLALTTLTAVAAQEKNFDMLQVGAQVYKNVTVTTMTKDYAFILHSRGMLNLKVSEMSPELLDKLGYAQKKASTNTWTQQAMAAVNTPAVKSVEQQVSSTLTRYGAVSPNFRFKLDMKWMIGIIGVLFGTYVFFCYCFHLICLKAGRAGGFLVWLPILQLIPLLRAANMSGWWFLAFWVPVFNLVAQILWSFKIAEARGKSFFCGLMLLLPVTNLLALLYLAFSSGSGSSSKKEERRPVQLMALETA